MKRPASIVALAVLAVVMGALAFWQWRQAEDFKGRFENATSVSSCMVSLNEPEPISVGVTGHNAEHQCSAEIGLNGRTLYRTSSPSVNTRLCQYHIGELLITVWGASGVNGAQTSYGDDICSRLKGFDTGLDYAIFGGRGTP